MDLRSHASSYGLAFNANSPSGMTGFDSVILHMRLSRSGMATVPDTHLSQPIIANRNYLGVRFAKVKAAFAPSFGFALAA